MRSILTTVILIFYCVIPTQTTAQDLDYAKFVVKTVSSSEYYGRGYTFDADKKAASFIKDEFIKHGVEPIDGEFYQNFEVSINAFPSTVELHLNGKELTPGLDYLVEPGSPTINGSFEIHSIYLKDLVGQQDMIEAIKASVNKFIYLPELNKDNTSKENTDLLNGFIQFIKRSPNLPMKGFIYHSNGKLTWRPSPILDEKAGIILSDEIELEPNSQIKLHIEQEYTLNYPTQNVMGKIKGMSSDSTIVLMAHYDHLGTMGKETIFYGANDNSSGVAMLLTMAKHFGTNPPPFDIVLLAFGAEELGLMGSRYFVQNPTIELSDIKFYLNFDLAGTGDEGIQVVNGSVFKNKFDLLTELNANQNLLPQVKIRGKACNSDHCFFDEAGVPGFYIYTLGGIKAYHDIHDKFETLPFTEFEDYSKLMIQFIESLK